MSGIITLCAIIALDSSEGKEESRIVPVPQTVEIIDSLEEDLQRTNVSSLDDLPTIRDYKDLAGLKVYQAEARYLNPYGNIGGLYTTDAISCVILIAMAKERHSGKLLRIGMTHIDKRISKESIIDFYDRLKTNPEDSIDVYVLNGVKENALKVLKATLESGARIRFFNANLDGHITGNRGDSAIVDRTGRIYQGYSSDLYGSPINSDDIGYGKTQEIRRLQNDHEWGNLVFKN